MRYQQLPNLLELDFGDSTQFTDLSIPLLPFNLTTLNLRYSSSVSGKSFAFLPRCLTDLDLDSSKSIFDYDIRHLPRTLKILELNSAIYLTNLCIPDLPPHLEQLGMRKNSRISLSSFSSFPYTLRSSQQVEAAIFEEWMIDSGAVHSSHFLECGEPMAFGQKLIEPLTLVYHFHSRYKCYKF